MSADCMGERARLERCLSFWGKTYGDAPVGVRPVLRHLIDVAAAARAFLEANPARTRREAKALGLLPVSYIALIAFLAGLHDLGKFARSFQAQRPDLCPSWRNMAPSDVIAGAAHWRASAALLASGALGGRFNKLFPSVPPGSHVALIAAIAGHHGRAPAPGDLDDRAHLHPVWSSALDDMARDAADVAFSSLVSLTGAAPAAEIDRAGACLLSWRLSGLITLADWVGSDAGYFGPVTDDISLREAWDRSLDAARRAIADKGLAALRAAAPALSRIAPRAAAGPRPMQAFAEKMALGERPCLVIIEDVTGSGKTEASFMLAMRLMAMGLAEGVYDALPTMATANGMFDRVGPIAKGLFEPDAARDPNVILSHGRSWLARALTRLETRPAGDEADEPSTARQCDAWIGDDRRRAFFADVGAGTIDQAFMAVLPKKHLTLRQYALAGRVLIVDEAHSFDPYMNVELARLLELQAMNGGSAIVLSATLSQAARARLVAAFQDGLRAGAPKPKASRRAARSGAAPTASFAVSSHSYPLLTYVHADGGSEESVPFDPRLARTVEIGRLDTVAAALERARDVAAKGAAVLVLRNSVATAIETAALLRAAGARAVDLFHARFAQIDRMAIEDRVIRRFGRAGSSEDRRGQILVATQVVEQSLDLDFDLIITDLAPIDLLIQRAGRLWRHMEIRPAASRPVAGPTLLVLSPDPDGVENEDWLKPLLGGGSFVYPGDVMWRSARALFAAGRIRTPEDYRDFIERVHGAAREPTPDCLARAAIRAEGEAHGQSALGAMNVIDLAKGYLALGEVSADSEIGTRLGEETVTIRLATRVDGQLRPWGAPKEATDRVAWALSEVKDRAARWKNARTPPEDAPLHAEARRDWNEWEAGTRLVEVDAAGRCRVDGVEMRYAATIGLSFGQPTAATARHGRAVKR